MSSAGCHRWPGKAKVYKLTSALFSGEILVTRQTTSKKVERNLLVASRGWLKWIIIVKVLFLDFDNLRLGGVHKA